jgi:hypothetical protein
MTKILPFVFRRRTKAPTPPAPKDWLDAKGGLRVDVTVTTSKESDADVDAPPRPRSE